MLDTKIASETNRITSSLLLRNFQLFHDLLKIKHNSVSKVYLFFAVTFIQLILSQMRTFDALINIHYDFSNITTMTESILSFAKYVDAQGLLRLNIIVYYVLFVMFQLMTVGNTLLYTYIIYLYTKEKIKPRKTTYGQVVKLFSELMNWMLFHLCIITFMEEICCKQDFQSSLNIQCGSNNPLMTIFACFGVFFAVINQLVITLFFQNSSDAKKDALNSENVIFLAAFQIFRAINAILCVVRPQSYAYFIFYLLFTFIGTSSFLLNIFYGSGILAFNTAFTRKYFTILLTSYLSLTSAEILDELMRASSYYKSLVDYSLIFLIFFGFFYFVILRNLINDFNIHARIHEVVNNSSSTHLKFQYFSVFALLELSVTQVNQDAFLKALIERHIDSNCAHPVLSGLQKCFCKRTLIFDSKKVREASLEKWITNKTIFVKFLLKSWMETFLFYHPNDARIKILYAKFLFEKLRNHQIALQTLADVERRFVFVLEQYDAFKLRMQIKKWVKEKNYESYKRRLDLESALLVEDEIDSIKQKIKKILNQNCYFWTLLQRNVVSLKEMNELLMNQFKEVQLTKDLWISVHQFLDYKKKWKFYYAWFTMYIINKKVKNKLLENFSGVNVNENDVFSEEIQEANIDEDIASVHSDLLDEEVQEKIDIKNKKLIFDKKSAIIHTNDDKMALILNVNKQFTKIFGYSRSESVNKMNIQELMTPVYAKHHPSLMEEFKLTGKASCLYSQSKIFCQHSTGFTFTAWKFVKFYLTFDCESQYVVLIRPTDYNNEKKQDLLLFNHDWEIDGMSLNLIQTLNLNSSLFTKSENQKQIMNLLAIAPKLIQYSKISRLLKEQDLQLLGMIRGRKLKSLIPSFVQDAPQINIKNITSSKILQIPQKPAAFSLFQDIEQSQLNLPISPSNELKAQNSFGDRLTAMAQKFERQNSEDENFEDINKEELENDDMKQEMQRVAHKRLSYLNLESNQSPSQHGNGEQDEIDSSETEQNSQDDYLIGDGSNNQKQKNAFGIMQETLEDGQPINFLFKIPDSYVQLAQHYKTMKLPSTALKTIQEEKQKIKKEDNATMIASQYDFKRQMTVQKELRKHTRMILTRALKIQVQDEEVKFYDLILSLYLKFSNDKSRKYKSTCVVKYKHIRNEKVGVMKITFIQEQQRVKRKLVPQVSAQNGFLKRAGKAIDQQQQQQNLNSQASKLFLDNKLLSLRSHISNISDENVNASSYLQQASLTVQQVDQALNSENPYKLKLLMKAQQGMGFQLLGTAEDQDTKLMVDWTQFQNQFKMQHGSQNVSLNPVDNIFRKEENNKAVRHLSKISYLAWFLRFMFMSILFINLFTFLWGPQQTFQSLLNGCERTYELSETQFQSLTIYDSCLDLLIYTPNNTVYTDLKLQNGTVSNKSLFYDIIYSRIKNSTMFLKNSIKDPDQQHVYFDNSLFNNVDVLDPDYQIFDVEIDQQDQLSQFVLRAHQLSHQTLSTVTVNDPNVEYIRFETLPYLFFSITDALTSILNLMQQHEASIEQFLVVVAILESLIFIIGFFGLLKIILWICDTFTTVLSMFINISQQDLQKISRQQLYIKNQFEYLLKKDDQLIGFLENTISTEPIANAKINKLQNMGNFLINEDEDEQNMIFVKKNKVIQQSDFLGSLTFKLSIAYLLFVLATASASLSFHLSVKVSVDNIFSAIQSGNLIVRDFTNAQVLMILVKEKYYDKVCDTILLQVNYEQNLYPNLSSYISEILLRLQQTPTNNHMTFGSFDDAFDQFYFGNICDFLQQQNNMDVDHYRECSQLSLKKLQQGAVAFNQYLVSLVQDIVLNQVDNRFGNANQIEIWEYSQSVEYLKQGYDVLLFIWNSETQNKLSTDLTTLTILIAVMLSFQLCVFLYIAESYLIDQLVTTYIFYRQIYKSYMPNDIVQKVKIIRAKLVIFGIIKK